MSDDTTTKPVCKDGVCYVTPPTIDEAENKTVESKSTSGDEVGPRGDPQMPDLQNIFASSFQNIHKMLAQSMEEPKKKSKKKHDDSDDSDSSEDDSDDTDDHDSDSDSSDYDGELSRHIPDYKWAAFHQLLDSHNALCTAFVKLLNIDEDDDEDDE